MKRLSPCENMYACPVAFTVDMLGGKWKALLLFHLMSGPKRFNELRRLIPDVTQRMITLQLRELEHDQVLHREVFREVPPKVIYSLAPLGQSLTPIIMAMRDWGAQHEEFIKAHRRIFADGPACQAHKDARQPLLEALMESQAE